jgi:hypothetical protein
MKLSDLLQKGDLNDLPDAQYEMNKGLEGLIDDLGNREIEAKDESVWFDLAHIRWLELAAGEPGSK